MRSHLTASSFSISLLGVILLFFTSSNLMMVETLPAILKCRLHSIGILQIKSKLEIVHGFTELICSFQMLCFGDLRLTIRISTSAGEQHPVIMESNIVYQSELIIGDCLLECPKEIVRRCHKQSAVFDGIFFISTQRRVWIFLCDTVKSLNKCLDSGRNSPKI